MGMPPALAAESAAENAAAFEASAGQQWTMPVGFVHARFEAAANAIKRTDHPTGGDALAAAVGIIGPNGAGKILLMGA